MERIGWVLEYPSLPPTSYLSVNNGGWTVTNDFNEALKFADSASAERVANTSMGFNCHHVKPVAREHIWEVLYVD